MDTPTLLFIMGVGLLTAYVYFRFRRDIGSLGYAENVFFAYHTALLLEKRVLEVRRENEELKKRYLELREAVREIE